MTRPQANTLSTGQHTIQKAKTLSIGQNEIQCKVWSSPSPPAVFWYLASNEVFNGFRSGYGSDLQILLFSFLRAQISNIYVNIFTWNIVEIFPFRVRAAGSDRSRAALALMLATLQQQNYIHSSSLNLLLWSQPEESRPNWRLKSPQFGAIWQINFYTLQHHHVSSFLILSSSAH